MHHKCRGKKADGTACGALPHLLDADGLCPAHRPGGLDDVPNAAAGALVLVGSDPTDTYEEIYYLDEVGGFVI